MINYEDKEPLEKGFIHIKWLDYDIKTAMMPSENYDTGYAQVFDTIERVLEMMGMKKEFDKLYPWVGDLDVIFYKRVKSTLDSQELPDDLAWWHAEQVPIEEALAKDVYYRIEAKENEE